MNDILSRGGVGGSLAYCILAGITEWYPLVPPPESETFLTSVLALGTVLTAILKLVFPTQEQKPADPAGRSPEANSGKTERANV